MTGPVTVSRDIAAPADALWEMVADLPRSWRSVGEITACEPGRRLGFRIKSGPFVISDWTSTFEPTSGGCRVTETWTDQRSQLIKLMSKRITGVAERSDHNRHGMQQTLANLAAAAEGPAPDPAGPRGR